MKKKMNQMIAYCDNYIIRIEELDKLILELPTDNPKRKKLQSSIISTVISLCKSIASDFSNRVLAQRSFWLSHMNDIILLSQERQVPLYKVQPRMFYCNTNIQDICKKVSFNNDSESKESRTELLIEMLIPVDDDKLDKIDNLQDSRGNMKTEVLMRVLKGLIGNPLTLQLRLEIINIISDRTLSSKFRVSNWVKLLLTKLDIPEWGGVTASLVSIKNDLLDDFE